MRRSSRQWSSNASARLDACVASAHGVSWPSGAILAEPSNRDTSRIAAVASRFVSSNRAARCHVHHSPAPPPKTANASSETAKPTTRTRRLRSPAARDSARTWANPATFSRSRTPIRWALNAATTAPASRGLSLGAAARQDFASATNSASAPLASSRARASSNSARAAFP